MSGRAALDRAQRLLRWGRYEGAAAAFRAAAAEITDDRHRALALLGLARALSAAGASDAGVEACRAAAALQPLDATAPALLAILLGDMGALDAAAEAAQAALSLAPATAPLLNLCASIALRRGQPEGAAALARATLAVAPRDQRALSLLALCASGLEAPDLGRLVRRDRVAAPEGFDDIDAFNTALARVILRHPDLRESETAAPLVGGRRLADFGALPAPFPSLLDQAFRGAAARWAAEAPRGLDHAPARLVLRGWANVMAAGAREAPHIHEGAWVSGVYYVVMPARGGDIVLGGHDLGPHAPIGWTEAIGPRPGDLLLFPSYLYHSVPPFEADGRRISIAMDLVPDDPAP